MCVEQGAVEILSDQSILKLQDVCTYIDATRTNCFENMSVYTSCNIFKEVIASFACMQIGTMLTTHSFT